jgi:putative ABC transport system ATP-binding protein
LYQLTDVSKLYHKGRAEVNALRRVNLTVEDGDFLTIQGPTGSGKTTLLLLMGALDRPTSGSLVLDGQDTSKLGEGRLGDLRARTLGFVFQNYNLMPTLSAVENVQAALVPLGIGGDDARRRSMEALEGVGLGDRAGHFPAELSGGEQQRVAIARALVKEPRVLLADEPTGNLDEGTRSEIMGLLQTVRANRELTLVIATHDSKVARQAPRTAMVNRGQLTLKKNPLKGQTAADLETS